jgi:hypothetical protein
MALRATSEPRKTRPKMTTHVAVKRTDQTGTFSLGCTRPSGSESRANPRSRACEKTIRLPAVMRPAADHRGLSAARMRSGSARRAVAPCVAKAIAQTLNIVKHVACESNGPRSVVAALPGMQDEWTHADTGRGRLKVDLDQAAGRRRDDLVEVLQSEEQDYEEDPRG